MVRWEMGRMMLPRSLGSLASSLLTTTQGLRLGAARKAKCHRRCLHAEDVCLELRATQKLDQFMKMAACCCFHGSLDSRLLRSQHVVSEPDPDSMITNEAGTAGHAKATHALELEAHSISSGGREIKAIRSRLDTTGSVRARGRPRALGGIVDGRVHYLRCFFTPKPSRARANSSEPSRSDASHGFAIDCSIRPACEW